MNRFRFLLLVVVVFAIPSSPREALGQKVLFMMASDTADSSLGNGCKATVAQWESTLRDLIPSDRYFFIPFRTSVDEENKYLTAKQVEKMLKQMAEGEPSNDTLVLLYHGHGGRFFGSHYVKLSTGEWIYSSDLQDLVKSVPFRLKIIMTCSCNTGVLDLFSGSLDFPEWDVDEDGIAPVMKSLFFDHKGLMHMNSAWPGNYSYSNVPEEKLDSAEALERYPMAGSWFFNEFLNYCRGNPTAQPSWRDIDKMLDERLTERFKEARKEGRISHANGNYLSHQKDAKIVTWSFGQKR